MSSPVEKIKEQLSILDVVSSYIKLDPAGTNMKARCPFHDEKTPSFFVSMSKGIYHCFGCGRGGDIFSFVEEVEGVDFKESLRILADRAGVSLEKYREEFSDEEAELYHLHDVAVVFYQKQFMQYREAFRYLVGRGITKKSAESFRLGFAPPQWDALVKHARTQGFSDGILKLSGLAIVGERGLYDRFRSRIMFPLISAQGKVVGFSGRVFDVPGTEIKKGEAKYVNSPETPIYHKSKFLYGYDKAKLSFQKRRRSVIVEGQMDLILAHQNGFSESVALSGTALTREHIRLIKRFTDRIILALDADEAGVMASSRSVSAALSEDCEVRIATMPEGKDPADVLQNDAEEFEKALSRAEEFTEFRLQTLKNKGGSPTEHRRTIEEELYPYVRMYPSPLAQDTALRSIANFLSLSHDAIREDFNRWNREHKESEDRGQGADISKEGKQEVQPREKVIEERIFGIYFWQKNVSDPRVSVDEFEKRYDDVKKNRAFADALLRLKDKKDVIAFSAEIFYDTHDTTRLTKEVDELFRSLKLGVLEDTLGTAMRNLREREVRGEDTAELLATCQEVSKEINSLKSSLYQ